MTLAHQVEAVARKHQDRWASDAVDHPGQFGRHRVVVVAGRLAQQQVAHHEDAAAGYNVDVDLVGRERRLARLALSTRRASFASLAGRPRFSLAATLPPFTSLALVIAAIRVVCRSAGTTGSSVVVLGWTKTVRERG
ncbi:MAG: hypothetical protein ABI276_03210, partial [Acidimicrobiales bacterium]